MILLILIPLSMRSQSSILQHRQRGDSSNIHINTTTNSGNLNEKRSLIFLLISPILLMAQSKKEVTEDFLISFADAFNAHDVKTIMFHMTDDCVFEASAGPDFNGEKFTGQKEVKQAFENVFAMFPDAHWGNARHFVSGNRGFSEWVFTGTKSDGTKVEVTGCDLFTFKDGKIAVKNSYRKNRQ